jgi:hypothetical protein
MIMRIFCVRDRATDQYGNPMFLVSRGQAIRGLFDTGVADMVCIGKNVSTKG